jgi:hypothetical protein
MPRLRTIVGLPIAAGVSSALVAHPARASLIWTGNPADGTSVFKLLNLEDSSGNSQPNPSPNGSSITTSTDPTYGPDFQFYKAANDKRAEAHGAAGFNAAIGNTYYIGWRFKVNSTVEDNAVFQWKAYGTPMTQDFPIVLSFNQNDQLQLEYYAPGIVQNVLWTHAESANICNTVVIAINVESDTTGTINFWFGGVEQNLAGGGTTYTGARTFDGTSVDPKWGIYGAVGTQVTDDVTDLAIGTTYADVAPTPVPEPASVGAILGAAALLARRRRVG